MDFFHGYKSSNTQIYIMCSKKRDTLWLGGFRVIVVLTTCAVNKLDMNVVKRN